MGKKKKFFGLGAVGALAAAAALVGASPASAGSPFTDFCDESEGICQVTIVGGFDPVLEIDLDRGGFTQTIGGRCDDCEGEVGGDNFNIGGFVSVAVQQIAGHGEG